MTENVRFANLTEDRSFASFQNTLNETFQADRKQRNVNLKLFSRSNNNVLTDSVDQDQTARSAQSDLGLYCPQEFVEQLSMG